MLKENENYEIAKLIYQADNFVFPFIYGRGEKGIKRLEKLIGLSSTNFSRKNIEIYKINGEIAGVINQVDKKDIEIELKSKDYEKVFKGISLYLLYLKSLLIKPLIDLSEVNSVYVETLVVKSKYRGNGIGTSLLNQALKKTKEKGKSRCG